MKLRRRSLFVASTVALVLMALVALFLCRHKQLYKVTVLPTLDNSVTWVNAINDLGQVVGTSHVAGNFHVFLWDSDNGIQDLGFEAIGGLDINNAGQISGTVMNLQDIEQAFFWDPNDGKQMLGTLGCDESIASGLNNRGQIVGTLKSVIHGSSGTRQIIEKAFIWHRSSGMQELFPNDRRRSSASFINDEGQMLGSIETYDSSGEFMPFFRDPNGTLATSPLKFQVDHRAGCDMNNSGYVLGRTQHLGKDKQQVLLWTKKGGTEGIKHLFYFERLDPYSTLELNDANQVVYGQVHTSALERFSKKHFPPYMRFYLRDSKRGQIVLDKQVPREIGTLVYLRDINNRGCIVGGIGLKALGYGVPVLLEPIPELWGK